MRRWWWDPETHARGVTWISPSTSRAIRELLTRLKLLRAMVKLPRMRIWTFLLPTSTSPVLAISTTSMTRGKEIGTPGVRWRSFSHAVKGPWLGFKMTMCHIRAKLSLLWNTLLPVRMFPENFAKRQESLQNEVAEEGNVTIHTISASSFPENEMAFLLLQSISSMTNWDFEYLILKFVTSDDNGVVRYKT